MHSRVFMNFLYLLDILGVARNIELIRHLNTPFSERTFANFQLFDGRLDICLLFIVLFVIAIHLVL